MALDIYKHIALNQTPRILSFLDRERDSITFGCFDRNYWHYRLMDFVNVRWQEGALLLSLIHSFQLNENKWQGNENVKDWLAASINYWETCQAKSGFFSESYPHERSFVATSFSVYAATEASLISGIEINREILNKAADWLSNNENLHVANQMAGGAAALANIYAITGDEEHSQAAKSKAETLLTLQREEGYFIEYGGYDMGYLTICLSYMAKYLRRIDDSDIRNSVIKAFEFLEDKIDDNCLFDYKQTSRGTQFLYPYGFVYFDRVQFLSKHTKALEEGRILNPGWMDDRFSLPLTIDYLESYLIKEINNANDNS